MRDLVHRKITFGFGDAARDGHPGLPGALHAFQSIDCHISRKARRVAHTAIKRALHGVAQ